MLDLPLPSPFDAAWALHFLSVRAVAGMEVVEGDTYTRAALLGGVPTAVSVRLSDRLEVRWAGDVGRDEVVAAVVRLFDLSAPPEPFAALAGDPHLGASVARRPGLRLLVFPDPWEGVVRGVLGQQVSVAAARTLAGRLVARAGVAVPSLGGHALAALPSPAGLRPEHLDGWGLPGARGRALLGAAQAVVEGRLDLAAPIDVADAQLRQLAGFGPWTATYVRLRGLGDRDAFPAGDLGVKKALARFPGADPERWRPWRAYATLHLWASLGDVSGG